MTNACVRPIDARGAASAPLAWCGRGMEADAPLFHSDRLVTLVKVNLRAVTAWWPRPERRSTGRECADEKCGRDEHRIASVTRVALPMPIRLLFPPA